MKRSTMKYQLGITTTLAIAVSASAALSDSYQVFFPSTMPGMIRDQNGDFKDDLTLVIVNTDSMNVTKVELDDYLKTFENERYSLGDNFTANVDGTALNADKRLIQDFKGTSLFIRENGAIWSHDNGPDGLPSTEDDGDNLYFDRILELDVTTGKVVSEKLIATSQEGYTRAIEAGYEVSLAETGDTSGSTLINFKSYSENISNATETENTVATKGNFSTNQITSADGASLFRQEDDGTVHIGENSIVLADELVSASGNDEIYSSSGVLQLGNETNHRTVVVGTLEVATPTQANHAANKSYVDTQDALTLTSANTYADAADAQTLKSAQTYANGAAAMAMAASQISLNVDPNSSLGFGMGFGNIEGSSAFSLGLVGSDQKSGVRYSVTGSYNPSTKQTGVGAGVFISLR